MLSRPLRFENLEDRQLLSGAGFDASAPQRPELNGAPTAVMAPLQPAGDAAANDGAGQVSSTAGAPATSTHEATQAESSTLEGAHLQGADAASAATTSASASTTAAGPVASAAAADAPSDGDSAESPDEYASAIAAATASASVPGGNDQPPASTWTGKYGPYASFADLEQMLLGAALLAEAVMAQHTQTPGPASTTASEMPARPANPEAVAIGFSPQAGAAAREEPGRDAPPHAAGAEPRAIVRESWLPSTAQSPDAASEVTPPAVGDNPTQIAEIEVTSGRRADETSLAGFPAVDLPALEAGVERFFERLDSLGEDLADPDLAWKIGAWSVAAAGAAAALEFTRAAINDGRSNEPLVLRGWRLPPPPRPKENPV